MPIGQDDAIPSCLSTGVFAGILFGARWVPSKKLQADFAVASHRNFRARKQNRGYRIAHQINLTGFEVRGEFEPIEGIFVIAGAWAKLNASQGHENMCHAGRSRTAFADWGFERNHVHCAVGLRK